MQTNELVGQVQHGPRLPHVDQALDATRATLENQAERMSAEESRRPSTRPPARKPSRYGAGF
jgi:uncharacterized protein (DUF2267 family)